MLRKDQLQKDEEPPAKEGLTTYYLRRRTRGHRSKEDKQKKRDNRRYFTFCTSEAEEQERSIAVNGKEERCQRKPMDFYEQKGY